MKQLQSNYCQAMNQLKALRSKHRQIEKENDRNLGLCEDLQRQLEIATGKKYICTLNLLNLNHLNSKNNYFYNFSLQPGKC